MHERDIHVFIDAAIHESGPLYLTYHLHQNTPMYSLNKVCQVLHFLEVIATSIKSIRKR